jgi:hypothetical protein
MKIEAMEALARDMVGDCKTPNVYFVSVFEKENPRGLILISRSFEAAYHVWANLPNTVESTLEDRLTGVVCSCEFDEEKNRWINIDDSQRMNL